MDVAPSCILLIIKNEKLKFPDQSNWHTSERYQLHDLKIQQHEFLNWKVYMMYIIYRSRKYFQNAKSSFLSILYLIFSMPSNQMEIFFQKFPKMISFLCCVKTARGSRDVGGSGALFVTWLVLCVCLTGNYYAWLEVVVHTTSHHHHVFHALLAINCCNHRGKCQWSILRLQNLIPTSF